MVEGAEDWNWSSYGITAGLKSCPVWFDRVWILSSYSKKEKTAIKHYIQFVANGVQQPSPWAKIKNQIYLVFDEFVDQVQTNITDKNSPKYQNYKGALVPKKIRGI